MAAAFMPFFYTVGEVVTHHPSRLCCPWFMPAGAADLIAIFENAELLILGDINIDASKLH